MSELYDILVETPPTKVILLALDQGLWDCERSLAELAALCEANHMEAVAEVTQRRQTPETGIVLGSGKLEEAHDYEGYLRQMQENHQNFLRFWCRESCLGMFHEGEELAYNEPMPYGDDYWYGHRIGSHYEW